jgi:fructose-bisphosphate aldolase class I
MEPDVDGMGIARYLWQRRNVVPFVKVDEGLTAKKNGVRLMKEFTTLDGLPNRAVDR